MSNSDKFSELRLKAEQFVNQMGLDGNLDPNGRNVFALLHELDVHQVELELQYRELHV